MVPVSEQYIYGKKVKCSNYRNLRCQKTDTDTGTLLWIALGKRYTLHVNWPGFKGLNIFLLCSSSLTLLLAKYPLMHCRLICVLHTSHLDGGGGPMYGTSTQLPTAHILNLFS